MSDEKITEGMKMFDIKPDYYVNDNYCFYSYDEDSEDAIDEDFEDDEEDWCIHGFHKFETCLKCDT